MRTNFYIGILAGLVFSSIFAIHMSAQSGGASVPVSLEDASIIKVGDPAPDFTVEMLDGSLKKLSDMRGKVVLVNFWATWCGPCMKEFKVIPEKLIKRFEGRADFVFIPISRGETRETVQKKMDQLKGDGIDFPVGIDTEKTIYNLYAQNTIPRNYLIGKDGTVVYASIGYTEEEFTKLVNTIDEFLK